MKVKVNVYNKQKEVNVDNSVKALIRKACRQALLYERFDRDAIIDVSIVDNEQIKQINGDCRGIDKETDVLSFPLSVGDDYSVDPETGACMLGDVVISAQKAVAQAKLYGHSNEREFAFLTVHSVLHLLGYDHVNSKREEKIMFNKQEEILDKMGLVRK